MAGVVLFSACQSKKEKKNAAIAKAEKELSESYNQDLQHRLIALYQDYATVFPEDSLSAEYLFRSADLNMRLGRGEDALADLDAVIAKYPNYERLPECYFMKGFVYENVLYYIDYARKAYYDFVAKFPSHKLALDASILITLLDKSPEEIVASFNDNASE